MAKIEELIDEIADVRLRAEIIAEVKHLKTQKKFGLVFEKHLPETVRLPKLPIRVGELVAEQGVAGNELWTVLEVKGSKAKCRRSVDKFEEQERTFSIKDLVIVKRFGDAIYPALVPVDRVARGGPEKPWHTVINADNFHALQLLLYPYEGQVDMIYIDPPYNTGARDWKYNNHYIDRADSWRHSKWLSMMEKRLEIAKRLLKPNGVLVVTIDDWENSHLVTLLEELMPEREISTVIIQHNPRGNISNNFAYTHEYAHFLIPNGKALVERKSKPNETPRKLRRWGHNSTRKARPQSFYPIYVKDGKIVRVGESPQDENFHPTGKNVSLPDGEIEVWPIDGDGIERRWNFGLDTINDELDRIIAIEKNGEIDLFITEEDSVYKTVWTGSEFEAGKHGNSLVKSIVGNEFPFPKSVYAVKRTLETIVLNRPDALILDFFSGSGTTYHATCLINAEYGGNRRCILVTNNEVKEERAKKLIKSGIFPGEEKYEQEGIAHSITWPRCKFVTQGHREDGTLLPGQHLGGRPLADGFEENLEFFKIDFLDPGLVALGQQFEAILPVLWMKAGCRGERETSRGSSPWFIPKNSPFAVLIKEQKFGAFKKEIAGRDDLTHVFFVTDSEENFRAMTRALRREVQTIQLYRSYLENFSINTELLVDL